MAINDDRLQVRHAVAGGCSTDPGVLEPPAGQLQPACPGPERGECPATHHQRRAPGSDCEDFAFYSLARLEEENKRREEERAGLKRNNPLSAFCYSDLTP